MTRRNPSAKRRINPAPTSFTETAHRFMHDGHPVISVTWIDTGSEHAWSLEVYPDEDYAKLERFTHRRRVDFFEFDVRDGHKPVLSENTLRKLGGPYQYTILMEMLDRAWGLS